MPHIQEIHSSPPSKPSSSFTSEEERTQRIRIKNRRKLYLDRHPSYFTSPDLELADPLLYDRCIRRFQTAAEREADGKAKGYSGVLEADLYRSEAKIAALHKNDLDSNPDLTALPSSSSLETPISYVRGENGDIVPEQDDEVPSTKEEGMERWRSEMTLRFLRGEDGDFEYEDVDRSEEWDLVEGREEEERWFEEEEPEWVGSSEGDEGSEVEGGSSKKERRGTGGETGVQDF